MYCFIITNHLTREMRGDGVASNEGVAACHRVGVRQNAFSY
jgi:hypothetical protein